MQPFTRLRSTAAVLLKDDVGADSIISVEDLLKTSKAGFAGALFAGWRYGKDGVEDPDFVLNRPECRGAQILVSGQNFGYGSSREPAVWAIRDYGFRCIVARSYGEIFYSNSIKNGLLPVSLPDDVHQALLADMKSEIGPLEIDLEGSRITTASGRVFRFHIPELHRRLLLDGLDAIEYAGTFRSQINAFRAADRQMRPWIYSDAPVLRGQ
jgi:3-isopropylmalate/(R)-2-methylmalate dehydratase small subunit